MIIKNNYKTVGILGGLGPEASNKFCELLIKYKTKEKDQDNIPFIHISNPQIPDRASAYNGQGESPVPEMVKTCNLLKSAGADFAIIPCNTAHVFLQDIQEQVEIPIINMIDLLISDIIKTNNSIKSIGVLGTSLTKKTGLYRGYLKKAGINVIEPTDDEQDNLLMEAIHGKNGLKAGKKIISRRLLTKAANNLIDRGAEALILGCTEIPLVLLQKNFDVKLYDPMEVAAREIIRHCNPEDNIEIKYNLVEIKWERKEFCFVVRLPF